MAPLNVTLLASGNLVYLCGGRGGGGSEIEGECFNIEIANRFGDQIMDVAHAHTCTHMHTHTHSLSLSLTHTRTHTHTYTLSLSLITTH